MPTTLPTIFYAILFGDDDYEFFDTVGKASDAAMELNHELREGYETGAEDPVRPIPIARLEIEPLDHGLFLRLLNDGPRIVIRSRSIVRIIEPDGAVTLGSASGTS